MAAAIEVTNLCKTYPRSWATPPFAAVTDVSLSVAEGEIFGFVGANGAGKSTVIKIITSVIAATKGQVSLFGKAVSDPASRRGMAYVPENPSLPMYLSPLEILTMGMDLHGIKVDNPHAHRMAWLERFELGNVANKVVRGFSKGMAQRTVLAHAMVVKPRLLILDEPLSGLDPLGRRDVVDILSEHGRNGGTLFFTSHVLHDVERLAHRYGLIHKGQLTAVRSPAELAGEDEMVTIRTMGHSSVLGLREEVPGRWYMEAPRGEVWGLLEQLKQAGHSLIEIRPVLSLESAFLRAVKVGT